MASDSSNDKNVYLLLFEKWYKNYHNKVLDIFNGSNLKIKKHNNFDKQKNKITACNLL